METELVATGQDRSFVVGGGGLELELDAELAQIAAAVARATSAPVVMVSLAVDRRRAFRVRYELIADVAVARGSEPGLGVCDLVARTGPVIIADTEDDAALPQPVAAVPGLRACLGVPVTVAGSSIGALCVIDTRPREFSPTQCAEIERLAERAGRRAISLAAEWRTQSLLLVQRVTAPVLVEMRAMMSMVGADHAVRLGRVADALDAALGCGDGPVTLAQAAAAAESLAYPATGRAGGVRWTLAGAATLAVAPSLAAAVIAAALSAVSVRLLERRALTGIAAAAQVDGELASIVLEAGPLDATDAADCAADVIQVLGRDPQVSVTAEGARVVVRVPSG